MKIETIDSMKSYGAGVCGVGIGVFKDIDVQAVTGWLQLVAAGLGVVLIVVRLIHDIKRLKHINTSKEDE